MSDLKFIKTDIILILMLAVYVFLGGCASAKTTVPTLVTGPQISIDLLNRPDPITLLPVDWVVYGEDNRDHATAYLADKPLICLTAKSYESLSQNTANQIAYIRELMLTIIGYETLINNLQNQKK